MVGVLGCTPGGQHRNLTDLRAKVKEGMTMAEVKSAIGAPDRHDEINGGSNAVFYYLSGPDELEIHFKDDKSFFIDLTDR